LSFSTNSRIAIILSSTFKPRKIEDSCGKYPIPSLPLSCIGVFVISLPSRVILPSLGIVIPTIV
jgi:hypothetical protein